MAFVIKTNSSEKSMKYLSESMYRGSIMYYLSETPSVYKTQKEVDKAIAWAEKDLDKKIKAALDDVNYNNKTKTKNETSINKTIMKEAKKRLATFKALKFKVIKF